MDTDTVTYTYTIKTTVEHDIYEYVKKQADKKRLSVSAYLRMVLAGLKEQDEE